MMPVISHEMWRRWNGGRVWRLTPDGVELQEAPGAVMRSPGEPLSMRLYLALWGEEIRAAAAAENVPVALLLMTIATENGGAHVDGQKLRVLPARKEPGYRSDAKTPQRISVGPCHLLISTARAAMADPSIDRAWLEVPGNNIRAAARYIAQQRALTQLDPILVAAAYNAGGLYTSTKNPWRLRSTLNHLERAGRWYGDACAALHECQITAALPGHLRTAAAA
jgi:hypothetical protein